ncbi:box C/D snoRNA protein 1 [Narcine bancroftii]|uniref:box C/D snoRNA protein 1 n=1 Tax=Narcine bancroftii TaxID=1343680 RepID=UPI003831EB48
MDRMRGSAVPWITCTSFAEAGPIGAWPEAPEMSVIPGETGTSACSRGVSPVGAESCAGLEEPGPCACPEVVAMRGPQGDACKRKISLSRCEACGVTEAKYRCPRCMIFSCSLLCVKRHKAERGCTGVRDKTSFTSLSDFSEMQLFSDYKFLEDTGRLADSARRDTFVHKPTTSKALNFMKKHARRCNVDLKLLPIGFTKRRENSTFYHKKEQKFYWHLKLAFPQSCITYTEKRVPDSKTVGEVLRRYVNPLESDPIIRQKLKVYALASLEQVCIFLKVEGRACCSIRYHRLDLNKSVAENLSHKMIIEYPTLLVVLKTNASEYRTLSNDNSNDNSSSGTDSSPGSDMEEGEIRDGS